MPYGIFMVLFAVIPLFIVAYFAFTDVDGNFSVAQWGTVFGNGSNWKVIGMTFVISALTTFFCLLIAYPIAYLLANSKYNKNKILVYMFLLPMWINFVIRTIGLKSLLNGMSDALFGFDLTAQYPYVAIVIGMVYDYLPFAILPLYNQMLKLDKNQIEAAADLGATPSQVFVKSIIPQTIPGIISACTMTFMPTMSAYVIATAMSEGNKSIIGNLINNYFSVGDATGNHVGSTLSLVMLIIVGVSILIEKLLMKKQPEEKGGAY